MSENRHFTIDWNNPEQIARTRKILLHRLQEIAPKTKEENKEQKHQKTNERKTKIFDACGRILETNISSLYNSEDRTPKYYVYVHCDTTKGINKFSSPKMLFLAAKYGVEYEPFYVGKGCGNRSSNTRRNETHRKVLERLKLLGKEVAVVEIEKDLTESDALSLESKIIDILGTKTVNGCLVNLDEGAKSKERRNFYHEDWASLHGIVKNFSPTTLGTL